jgi:tRNA A37 threonylcarbamoyladenosine synthetase subunit TsaC/SUA5/YrdC
MLVILSQTDTTVGFLSQNADALIALKGRDNSKPFLKAVASFKKLQHLQRVPLKYRSLVRHARKTTFILQGNAYRVINNHPHANLIKRYGWLYSTSANESTKQYDENFCRNGAEIIIEDANGFFSSNPSALIKLTHSKYKKLR